MGDNNRCRHNIDITNSSLFRALSKFKWGKYNSTYYFDIISLDG